MISNEDIAAMMPADPEIETVSVKLGDIKVDYEKPKHNANKRPYMIEALGGSMSWFTAEEILDWQKRMNTAIALVLAKTGA
jgi:hypothetical protein